jgi:hypothetical protein
VHATTAHGDRLVGQLELDQVHARIRAGLPHHGQRIGRHFKAVHCSPCSKNEIHVRECTVFSC